MRKSIWDTRFGKRGVAQDERVQVEEGDSWKTIHGAHVLLGDDGRIKAGAGGKFTGMHLEAFGGRPNEDRRKEHLRNIMGPRNARRAEGSEALKKGGRAPAFKEMQEYYKDISQKSLDYASKYEYKNPPRELKEPMSEVDAIDRIAGDDKTEGSCASASIAFIANQELGLDVRDFRGGVSEIEVSATCCAAMAEMKANGFDEKAEGGRIWTTKGNITATSRKTALDALDSMQPNKNYVACIGGHQSVVRKLDSGEVQYLELQNSGRENNPNGFSLTREPWYSGWHTLMPASSNEKRRYEGGDRVLRQRFDMDDGRGVPEVIGVVPTERYAQTKYMQDRLQYVNTSEKKQLKGDGGSIK